METSIIIDTSLTQENFQINFRKRHEIWGLFVKPFKSQRGHNVPPPPRQNRVNGCKVEKGLPGSIFDVLTVAAIGLNLAQRLF